jgi:Signal transduction histidine kinase
VVMIRNSIAENYTELEEHGTELDIAIPDEEITDNGDRNELKRAITNLIVNIYKHNPDGIKAAITVCEENGRAISKISDSGNEIPDGMNIFEPFVTVNASRTAGQGAGLGLAVTKRVI